MPSPAWWTPDPSLGSHTPNWNHDNTSSYMAAQMVWNQTGIITTAPYTQVYDGTREARGMEACSDVLVTTEGWYGFLFYPPSSATSTLTYPNNKTGAIAQIFQNGYCNSWAALLIVQNGALMLNWRDYCGDANVIPLANSIKYDQWNPIIIHWVVSNNNTGQIQVWYGDDVKNPNNPTYNAQNVNFGFAHGWTTGGPLPSGSEQPLKFGMYNFDDGNYTPGERRTMLYDNVTQSSGNDPNGWWHVNPLY
jgi:hypothetical protein